MLVEKREVTMRFLAQPIDANFGGKVHGGSVMKWIDQGGYACATGWSKNYCVTVYLGDLHFHLPIQIGDLVEVHAKIIYTGKTSMHIDVEVRSCNPTEGESKKATHCVVIFVAVDKNGNPTQVPTWKPLSKEDICLEDYAKKSMELRKNIEKELNSCLLS